MNQLFEKYNFKQSDMKMLQVPIATISVNSSVCKSTITVTSITETIIEDFNTCSIENNVKDLCLGIDVGLCNWPNPKTKDKYPTIYFTGLHFDRVIVCEGYLELLYKNIKLILYFVKQSWFVTGYHKIFNNCTFEYCPIDNIQKKYCYNLAVSILDTFDIQSVFVHGQNLKKIYEHLKENVKNVTIRYTSNKIDKYISKMINKKLTLIFDANTVNFPKNISVSIDTLSLFNVSQSDAHQILQLVSFNVREIEIVLGYKHDKQDFVEFKKTFEHFEKYEFKFIITSFNREKTKKFQKVFKKYCDHSRLFIETE